jgi:hypothetical protein
LFMLLILFPIVWYFTKKKRKTITWKILYVEWKWEKKVNL